jgi:hypothetical protein
VLAGDLGDDESLRASLDGMHADIERARSNLEAAHVAAARSRIAAATWTSSSATAARSSTCTSAGSTRPRGSSAAHPESADGGRGSGPVRRASGRYSRHRIDCLLELWRCAPSTP